MALRPKFSIITVTYNASSVIEPTLQSVAAQSYKNYEYLLIDGASTDDTVSKAVATGMEFAHIVSEGDSGLYDAMNKGIAKQFFRANGIPTPNGVAMTKEKRNDDVTSLGLRLPVVVKPCCGGSSIGVTIAKDSAEFTKALDEAFRWEDELIIEEFVQGREFSCGVIEGKALPVIEIAPLQGFYDYKNKYKAGSAVETCPADLPEEVSAQMRAYAEAVAKVIGLDTYSRSDFLISNEGEMYCLEANTLPGMTPTSLLPQEAAAAGISFQELCEMIVAAALR